MNPTLSNTIKLNKIIIGRGIDKKGRGVKNWLFAPIILLLGICAVTVLEYFKIFGTQPDLLLISMVFASIFFAPKEAIILAISAGVLKDVFLITTFGINTLSFGIGCILIIYLSRKITLDNNYLYALLVFLMMFIQSIIIRLISLFGIPIPSGIFLRQVFFGSLYTAIIAPLLFKFFRLIIYQK